MKRMREGSLGRSLGRAVILLTCTFIILLPALINGFPLVYSDTGTYLKSAFEGYIPFDRPYWYGVFVRITSGGGLSLWGIVIVQSALCAAYILRVSKLLVPAGKAKGAAVIFCAVLTAGTGLGWYAGQLIPDIFTGIGLLAVYLLLRGREGAWLRDFDVLIVVAACWMHLSNLIILPLVGCALLILGRWFSPAPKPFDKKWKWLVASTVLAWAGLGIANRVVDGAFYLSRSGHVFLVGRMVDTGMLKAYLKEHCATEHFNLCAYADSLPGTSGEFLWGDNSPVWEEGGWKATGPEYDLIIRGTLAEPRFLLWHVRASVASTAEQLCAWHICGGLQTAWYRSPDCPPYDMISQHMHHELGGYLASMQNGGRGELEMRWPNTIYELTLGLALILAMLFLIRNKGKASTSEVRLLIVFTLVAIVIGAWACATLSVVDTRYLGRDSWLLPLAVLIAITAHPGLFSLRRSSSEQ